jgi:hypothetical protein
MGTAIDELLGLQSAADRFDVAPAEVATLQIEAANERLQTRIDQIPLLRNRARTGGITKIVERKDLIPLLFAHSAYKSYAESWLADGKWERMATWLRTVSTNAVEGVDLADVDSLDTFIARLESVGCYVGCSSGTTGKPALIASAEADIEFASQSNVHGFAWATGIEPAGDRRMIGLGPRMNLARNEGARAAMVSAFSSEDNTYQMPLPPIDPSSMIDMVVMRRRVAEGTASPSEVAAFEGMGAARAEAMAAANASAVDDLIASRTQKLLLGGMFTTLYEMSEAVRAKGFSGNDFSGENAILVGGGLKGNVLPDNYREYICETLGVPDELVYSLYSMQEINTSFPKCRADRYHVPPWVLVLPLDEPGENLLGDSGRIEGRAAFFDVSLEGRWGGVISGDLVDVDFDRCACGHAGPTVGQDIRRYSDTAAGDKISCSGTIDAYVRGES